MARRQRWNQQAEGGVSGDRSSIGDNYVVDGINKINKWCEQEICMRVEYSPTTDQLIHMLIPDEMTEKLRAVKGMVEPASNIGFCDCVLPHVELTANFKDSAIPCPTPEAFALNRSRAAQLIDAVALVKQIHEKYEVVKHVLRWLNRNATPGAIRYYFPAAMALCPTSPALAELQHVPLRFTTPEGIAEQLPLIREAGGTVAACAMMRADSPVRLPNHVRANFKQYTFHRAVEGVITDKIKTDARIYHL